MQPAGLPPSPTAERLAHGGGAPGGAAARRVIAGVRAHKLATQPTLTLCVVPWVQWDEWGGRWSSACEASCRRRGGQLCACLLPFLPPHRVRVLHHLAAHVSGGAGAPPEMPAWMPTAPALALAAPFSSSSSSDDEDEPEVVQRARQVSEHAWRCLDLPAALYAVGGADWRVAARELAAVINKLWPRGLSKPAQALAVSDVELAIATCDG